jgi:hypothetical protein
MSSRCEPAVSSNVPGSGKGTYQDPQEAVQAIVVALAQEQSGGLFPQMFRVMGLKAGSRRDDGFERAGDEGVDGQQLEAFGWEGASRGVRTGLGEFGSVQEVPTWHTGSD